MKSDLHFHSRYSDGHQWPEEMVLKAKSVGLEMIALTDHDTMGGVKRFMEACKKQGISGLPAVEIDYDPGINGYRSELLAYFPDGNYASTDEMLAKIRTGRRLVASTAFDIMDVENPGNDLSLNDLIRLKLGEEYEGIEGDDITILKEDILDYLVSKGLLNAGARSERYVFKKMFFGRPKFKAISQFKPDLFQLLTAIKKDGGYAVLAHPANHYKRQLGDMERNREECLRVFSELKGEGLWGVELHSYENIPDRDKLNDFFEGIATKTKLRITYGSDSHGTGSNKDLLGQFYGDFIGFRM